MPYCAYQGTIAQPPPLSVSLTPGGSISLSGTYYFWLQIRNRAGYSVPSASRSIVAAPGQIINIAIPAAARPSPDDGTYSYEFTIVANTVDNPATATIVATYPGYFNDEVSKRPLPGLVQLTQNSHLVLGGSVPLLSGLASIAAPIHGMRRLVTEDDTSLPATTLNRIVAYNAVANVPGWYIAHDQVFSPYVSNTIGTLGSLADIYGVRDQDVITPVYALSTNPNSRNPSTAVGYWLINDSTSVVKSGTRVALSVAIGDRDVSAELAGRLRVVFRGYVNTTTGILDRGNGVGGTMAYVDVDLDYAGDQIHVLALPKDLPAGSACWFDVYAIMTLAELNNRAPIGSKLRFAFAFFTYRSIPSSPVGLFGSFIAADFGLRLLVTDLGMGLKALNGSGKLSFPTIGTSFDFWNVGEQSVLGLQANTPDQEVYITKEGTCLVMDTPTSTVALRGVVGTVDGIGSPTAWSNAIALNGTQNIRLVVTYPTQVRSDYPDDLLAGNGEAEFNAYGLRIYVRRVGQFAVYYDVVTTPGSATGTFDLGAVTGTVGEPAEPGDPYFGLFKVADAGFTRTAIAGTSTLPAGNYEVAIALRYFGNVTKIRHDLPGVIYTFTSSIQAVLERSEYWSLPVSSPTALRSWPHVVTGGMRVGLLNSPDLYYWDQDSVAADDGVDTLQITGRPTGRFVRLRSTPAFSAGNGISLDDDGTTVTISAAPISRRGYWMGLGAFTYYE